MNQKRTGFPWASAGFVMLALALPGLTGCDANDGPAEEMGETLDDAADEAGDAMEDAADDMEDAADDLPEP